MGGQKGALPTGARNGGCGGGGGGGEGGGNQEKKQGVNVFHPFISHNQNSHLTNKTRERDRAAASSIMNKKSDDGHLAGVMPNCP